MRATTITGITLILTSVAWVVVVQATDRLDVPAAAAQPAPCAVACLAGSAFDEPTEGEAHVSATLLSSSCEGRRDAEHRATTLSDSSGRFAMGGLVRHSTYRVTVTAPDGTAQSRLVVTSGGGSCTDASL